MRTATATALHTMRAPTTVGIVCDVMFFNFFPGWLSRAFDCAYPWSLNWLLNWHVNDFRFSMLLWTTTRIRNIWTFLIGIPTGKRDIVNIINDMIWFGMSGVTTDHSTCIKGCGRIGSYGHGRMFATQGPGLGKP